MKKRKHSIKPKRNLANFNVKTKTSMLNVAMHIIISGHPCVEILYTDSKGESQKGYMMLDSCCMTSHLLKKAGIDIKTDDPKGEKNIQCMLPYNIIVTEECVSMRFSIAGIQFENDFSINEKFEIQDHKGLPIVGILGIDFKYKSKNVKSSLHCMHFHFCLPTYVSLLPTLTNKNESLLYELEDFT